MKWKMVIMPHAILMRHDVTKIGGRRMQQAKYISVKGAVDLHVHAGEPCCVKKPFTDVFVAQQAAAAGMEALVLKSAYENTVARAYYVNQIVPTIKLFGGITLNRYVGGLNPSAVEAVLLAGGREVWMPTFDSAHYIEVFGNLGTYDIGKGYRVIEDGRLKEEAREIVRLVAKHNAILACGHLYKEEIFELARFANQEGAKMLVDHAFYTVPGFTYDEIDQLKELTRLGAYIGLFAVLVFPRVAPKVNLDGDKKCIETLSPEHCVICSDTGAGASPFPSEALRTYAQNLFDLGIPLDALELMMIKNPRKLLSL